MNVVYDKVGHGDQYWKMIVGDNARKKKDRELQEKLNFVAHEKALIQENPNYETPFNKNHIDEQETLSADKDPLFKKVSKSLKKSIDYPDKPARAGYPNDPPPKMINGYHPDLVDGRKVSSYYNRLDPTSAMAMPKTGNDFIDKKVKAAVAKGKKKTFEEFKDLNEQPWFPIAGNGPTNSASQTFAFGDPESGIEYTVNGLGGQTYPSGTEVFGDPVPTPDYSQLAMQGYTPPLGNEVMRRDPSSTRNTAQNKSRLAEIEARLNELPSEIYKIEHDFYKKWDEIQRALPPLPNSLLNARFDPEQLLARTGRYSTWELNGEELAYVKALAKYEKDFADAKKNDLVKKLQDIKNEREALEREYNYLFGMMMYAPSDADETDLADEIANNLKLNHQLDSSEDYTKEINADEFMKGRVTDTIKPAPKFGGRVTDTTKPAPKFGDNITDPNNPDYNKRFAPITAGDEYTIDMLDQTYGKLTTLYPDLRWTQKLTIDYAKGNLSPRKVSPGKTYNAGVLKAIEHNLGVKGVARGDVSTYNDMNPVDIAKTATTRLSMGRFNYKATTDGLNVTDFFNFDGNLNLGVFGQVSGLNDVAKTLVDLGQRRAAQKGYKMVHKMKNRLTGKIVEVPISPDSPNSPDGYGIDINFTIPWSEVSPELQNKLDPTATIIPTTKRAKRKNRRGRVIESTWNKLNRHRGS